ncbi:histidine kinase [Clostridium sp. MCC353]|uniref:sensor histidine kinase n=1 Tax=Clostridium sp. MCC353 TaxID=2592646 RepID=UPI001C031ED2|nr:histidine kinase [Clostridium sp. MCC353]
MEKTTSAKKTLIKGLAILLIPLALVLGISTYYSFDKLQETVYISVQNSLRLMVNDMNRQMDGVGRYLNELALNNTYIHQLSRGTGEETTDELNRYEVYCNIKERMNYYDNLTAVYLYTAEGNVTLSCINRLNYITKNEKVNLWLHMDRYFQEMIENEKMNGKGWEAVTVDGRRYFCKAVENQGIWLAALFDAEHMADISPKYNEMNGILTFFQGDVPQCRLDQLNEEHITWEMLSHGKKRIQGAKEAYWAASEPLQDFTVVYLVPHNGSDSRMPLLPFLLVALVWGFVIFILCAYKLLKKNYFKPMDMLITMMDDIGSGRLEMGTPSAFSHTEFRKLDDTFNHMIEQIRDLKISSYEKELEMKQIQLVSLQNQIRPHFYLNCLKNLYALLERKRYGEAQENILLLSRHFRYVFSIQDSEVKLEQEIMYCQNYVKLFSSSYSQNMRCETDIMPDALEYKVPSISLLTFVENSVKYAGCPDRMLKIQIKVKLLQIESSRILSVSVADNGEGFRQELMEKLNQGIVEADYDGGVGIGNVLHRCRLLYGDRFSYGFYNEDGAVVDLFFEIQGEEEEKYDLAGSG